LNVFCTRMIEQSHNCNIAHYRVYCNGSIILEQSNMVKEKLW
jgi:hypothetical protein